MKLKPIYLLLIILLFCTCKEDLPLLSLPAGNITAIDLDITSVNGGNLEATIQNLNGFDIGRKGFLIAKSEFDCPNNINNTNIIPDENSSLNSITGSISGLDLNEQYFIRAFIEVIDEVTGDIKIVCSNLSSTRTGALAVAGFSEIIEKDGAKTVQLTGRLSGLKVEDEASNHGFVWYVSDTPIENGHPDPDSLINAADRLIINKGAINGNQDFKEAIENRFLPGVFYYVMPFVELNGQMVFDLNDDGSWKYEEVFIGDFWVEIDNSNQESDGYPNSLAEAVSFEIEGVGYIGTGFKVNDAGTQFATSTFWAYYPETNEYKRLANFPGIEDGRRRHAVGFSIDGKGYVGLGYIGAGSLGSGNYDQNDNLIYKDFYEFTPDEGEGSWRRLADAPFPIFGAVSFVLENKGYVVAGWITLEEDINGDGSINQGPTNRVFRFNPERGTLDSLGLPLGEWVQLERVPNNKGLVNPIAFAVNDKGYLASGVAGNGSTDEVYEFSPTAEGGNWVKKNNFPGSIRQKAVSFVIDDKAYLATGSNAGFQGILSTFKDLWEYNSTDDSWTQRSDIDKFNLDSGTAFSIRGKGYVYAGFIAKEISTISSNMRVYTPKKEIFKRATQN